MEFADETNLGGSIDTEADWIIVREQRDDFEEGTNRKGMKFCSVESKA